MKHVAEWLKILAEKKPQNVVNCLPTLALTLQRNEAMETGCTGQSVHSCRGERGVPQLCEILQNFENV